jgi:hypothetical protein
MASKPILIEARYRSHLEKKVADQLDEAGVDYGYESQWVRYSVPQREAKYLPDFTINDTNCGIRGIAATDSDGRRPAIPIESGHPIRTKVATLLIG